MSQTTPSIRLLASLQAVRRRIRVMGLIWGLGLVAAAAVGLVLLLASADYLLNLPAGPRLVMLCAAVGVWTWLLGRFVLAPLTSRLTLDDVAQHLEQVFPQFEDRLRSAVNFLGAAAPDRDELKNQVVAQTVQLAGQVDLRRALTGRPVLYSCAGAGGAVALLLLVALLVPRVYRDTALLRIFSPLHAPGWPRRTNIALAGPWPDRLPAGQSVNVRVKLVKGDSPSAAARVHYQLDDAPLRDVAMARATDGTLTAALETGAAADRQPRVLRAWVESGDDRLLLPPVIIVPQLVIQQAQALIVPPPYAPQQPIHVDLATTTPVLTAGSSMQLSLSFNRPLDVDRPLRLLSVESSVPPPFDWTYAAPAQAVGSARIDQSLRFGVEAHDIDGFTNPAPQQFQWMVRADQPPLVHIESPRADQSNTPEAQITLQAAAGDDFGIADLKLIVLRLNDQRRWEIDLLRDAQPAPLVSWQSLAAPAGRQRYQLDWVWPLAQLTDAHLRSGDVLEYHLEARDNFALDGQRHEPVASGRLRITIVTQQELAGQFAVQLQMQKQRLMELKKQQEAASQQTRQLASSTADKPALDSSDQSSAQRLADRQSAIADQTRQLAGQLHRLLGQMDDNRSSAVDLAQSAAEVARLLDQTAQQLMKPAADRIDSTRQSARDAAELSRQLTQANQDQLRAADQLDQALAQLDRAGAIQLAQARLTQLLQNQQQLIQQTSQLGQQNLGLSPDQMNDQDRQQLRELAQQQGGLADQTQSAIDQMQRDAARLHTADPATATRLALSVAVGHERAVRAHQQQAQAALGQNLQGPTSTSQHDAASGLTAMLEALGQQPNDALLPRQSMQPMQQTSQQQQASSQAWQQLQQLVNLRQHYAAIRDEQINGINQPTQAMQAQRNDRGLLSRAHELMVKSQLAPAQGQLTQQVQQLQAELPPTLSPALAQANQQIVANMDQVQQQLALAHTDELVQSQQGEIVNQLDQLIAALDQQLTSSASAQSSSAGSAPNPPPMQSSGQGQSVPTSPSAQQSSQSASPSSSSQSGPAQQMAPAAGQTDRLVQQTSSAASASDSASPGVVVGQSGVALDDLREHLLQIAPRLRDQDLIEGNFEQPIEQYKAVTDEYYRALASEPVGEK